MRPLGTNTYYAGIPSAKNAWQYIIALNDVQNEILTWLCWVVQVFICFLITEA